MLHRIGTVQAYLGNHETSIDIFPCSHYTFHMLLAHEIPGYERLCLLN